MRHHCVHLSIQKLLWINNEQRLGLFQKRWSHWAIVRQHEWNNYGKEKNQTTCFPYFCQTKGLNYRKSTTIWKIFERSSNCDVAGLSSFFCLEMASDWRKISLIEKRQILAFFPTIDFSFNVFINIATQSCHSYLISMSKLKSFKFSLKWRQERIFNSKHLVFRCVLASL